MQNVSLLHRFIALVTRNKLRLQYYEIQAYLVSASHVNGGCSQYLKLKEFSHQVHVVVLVLALGPLLKALEVFSLIKLHIIASSDDNDVLVRND